MMLMLVGIDDPVGRETRRPAVRVVDHDDILDPEQVLRDSNGPKRIDGSAAGNDDREDGRR